MIDRFSPVHLISGPKLPTLSVRPEFWRMLAESEDDEATRATYRRNEAQAEALATTAREVGT